MTDISARLSAALADRYRLEREVGAGGMATVYLAEDLKHNRKVAIKVLRPELAAVLGGDRFVQEIATTAALQHPNILPLFDSGSADTFLYYVMPFVEGETLRAKLSRETQLSVDESVKLVSEVADALQYAHDHGIVHRDIKPENILIHAGRPMVADFGIALAVSAAAGGRMTETGLSLGTPHYMSPEQATAEKHITNRSDIYSLAAVLYEMLSGQPPHVGSSAQQIIMKIIAEATAPVTALRKSVPPNVAAALARALEKLPADRFDSARAFAQALTNPNYQTATATGLGVAASGPVSWRTVLRHPITIGLTVALLGTGVAWWRASQRVEPHTTVRFALAFPPDGKPNPSASTASPFTMSPDGRSIVYVGTDQVGAHHLYLRSMDDVSPRVLPGTTDADEPSFSPDGKWIAFWGANGQLDKVPVEGGAAVPLAEATTVSGIAWGKGRLLVSSNGYLSTVPETGGPIHQLGAHDSASGEVIQLWPVMLPDGVSALYSSWPAAGREAAHIAVANTVTGKIHILDLVGTAPLAVLDNILVYATSGGAIMAVPFDASGPRVLGTPVQVLDGVVTGGAGAFKGAVSASGTLVYSSGSEYGPLILAEPRGATRVLVPEARGSSYPRYSPDGKHLAIAITDTKTTDIWVLDLPSGPLRRLTSDGSLNDRPEWTADSRRVLFRSNRGPGGQAEIWAQDADGNTPAERYFALKDAGVYEGSISADGAYFIFQRDSTGGSGRTWFRRLKGDSATGVIAAGTQGQQTAARFSPDVRWVAYESDELGTKEIYIKPFPSLRERYQISLQGGAQPVWSRDGRRLFYMVGQRLLSATLSLTSGVSVIARDTLFDNRIVAGFGFHANYDVAPDGKHFVFITTPEGSELAPVIVVHDWKYEVLARMRGASVH